MEGAADERQWLEGTQFDDPRSPTASREAAFLLAKLREQDDELVRLRRRNAFLEGVDAAEYQQRYGDELAEHERTVAAQRVRLEALRELHGACRSIVNQPLSSRESVQTTLLLLVQKLEGHV